MMTRRGMLAGGAVLGQAGVLRAQGRKGMPSLKITKVEAFIVRTPPSWRRRSISLAVQGSHWSGGTM